MQPADFHFELPAALIAQQPLVVRTASRLLRLHRDGRCEDLLFPALAGELAPGDLLVVNDSRVIPARVFGQKDSGGKLEMLVERLEAESLALVQLRASKAPRIGTRIWFDDTAGAGRLGAEVVERRDEFYLLRFDAPVAALLERIGHVPLPPYIRRPDAPADRERYQTVYARAPGSVAAPTAGLHFDGEFLDRLRAQGVGVASVTLHVGAGTFAPLRPHSLKTGHLHAERVEVSESLCAAIAACRTRHGRVVAVGTTTLRALESAAVDGELRPFSGETTLFVRPGYRFQVVDALLTNFHLPESSLLMLVCAFGGVEPVLAAYAHAVEAQYRFYSYGDAMFLERAA